MSRLPHDWLLALVSLLQRERAVVRVVIAEARGSVPREPGAFMLVTNGGVEGTVGGGRLEWECIAAARKLLDEVHSHPSRPVPAATPSARLSKVVLAADVGQCCGGVVSVWLDRFTRDDLGLLALARDAGSRAAAVLSSTIRGASVERRLICDDRAGVREAARRGGLVGDRLPPAGDAAVAEAAGSDAAAGDLPADDVPATDVAPSDRAVRDVAVGRDAARAGAGGAAGDGGAAGSGGAASHACAAADGAAAAGTAAHPDGSVGAVAAAMMRLPRVRARPQTVRGAAGELTFFERLDDAVPALWLYGAGHVGQALARIVMELPVRLTWVDSRAELFPTALGGDVRLRSDSDMVATVSEAPMGAYFLVMTHSHPLDYDLCRAILQRNNLAWLGLIGSESKAARFRSRLARDGVGADRIARLVCPIGVRGIESKWPAAIAVGVAAQLLQEMSAATMHQGLADTAQEAAQRLPAQGSVAHVSPQSLPLPLSASRAHGLSAPQEVSLDDSALPPGDCGQESCSKCGARWRPLG